MSSIPATDDYALLDSGHGKKLERFGRYVLAREPCSQAVWEPACPETVWTRADARIRPRGRQPVHNRGAHSGEWTIATAGITF
jgi:hypothetical protein